MFEQMVKVLCIGESHEAQTNLSNVGCRVVFSPSGEVAEKLIELTETTAFGEFKLVVVYDWIASRQVGIRDIQHLRNTNWKDGPILFMTPERETLFNFDFNKARVEFIRTPVVSKVLAETIARIARE